MKLRRANYRRTLFCGIFGFLVGVCSQCNAYGLLSETSDSSNFVAADRAYAFVSSQTTQGNMQGLTSGGCAGGGLAQADCACTALAKSANLLRRRDSRFAAWLSTPTEFARCRVLGQNGTGTCNTGGEDWYNTDNTLFASGIGTVLNFNSGGSGITNVLRLTENGQQTTDAWAYTGTLGNDLPPASLPNSGSAALQHCNSWSLDNTGNAQAGTLFSNTFAWTASTTQTCDAQLPVYCFALP